MTNSISISFVKGIEESVVLFSHWDGRNLLLQAQKYVKELKEENGIKKSTPLERLEPNTVMVDFIRHITTNITQNFERVENNYYLCKERHDGDNTNHGHWEVDLETGFVR